MCCCFSSKHSPLGESKHSALGASFRLICRKVVAWRQNKFWKEWLILRIKKQNQNGLIFTWLRLPKASLPRIRFHDLRHSFATLSLEQGIDIKTVSHMLGHTDAGFTMNTYMHVTDDMQQSAANTIGSLLDESTKNSKVVKFPA